MRTSSGSYDFSLLEVLAPRTGEAAASAVANNGPSGSTIAASSSSSSGSSSTGHAPVLFLHGFLGGAEDWAPLLAALGLERRCVALDLPGHGSTQVIPSSSSSSASWDGPGHGTSNGNGSSKGSGNGIGNGNGSGSSHGLRSWGAANGAHGGSDGGDFEFDAVVNCAGLRAQSVAKTLQDYPQARVPKQVLAKGNYFTFTGRPAFSRLIYPAPVHGGLGVHVTLDLAGRMRFGPDVEWIDREYYPVDPKRADVFYERIRTYFPAMPDGSLAPDDSGIRPKLTGPGEPAADFLIDGPAHHNVPGLVQMFGIESPGLTSSLSLAEEVADLVSA